MRWLRSTWRLRSLVMLLMASLLPVTVVVPGQSAVDSATSSHADWLRTQVEATPEEDVQDAFEEAIEVAATSSDAQTLQGFLEVFKDAYEAQNPSQSLAELFGMADRSSDAIVRYLKGQLSEGLELAPLPRLSVSLLMQAAPTATSTDRTASTSEAAAPPLTAMPGMDAAVERWVKGLVVVQEVRTLFTAYPRGP